MSYPKPDIKKKEKVICRVSGCFIQAQQKGVCKYHYSQIWGRSKKERAEARLDLKLAEEKRTKSRYWNAVKKCDVWFSKYMRLSLSDDNGICSCITCGKRMAWSDGSGNCHLGHFQSRRHMNTRYEKRNVYTQCKSCNTFNQGEQYKFGKGLDRIYGEGTGELMQELSKIHKKYNVYELEAMSQVYKKQFKELKKKSGL